MTLAVAVTCPEGVACSVDSRICLDLPQPPVVIGPKAKVELPPEVFVFSDSAEKLAVVQGRFLVCSGGKAPAGTPSTWIAECAAAPTVQAAGSDPDAFLKALAAFSGARHPNVALLVAYVDDAGHPRVFYTHQSEVRAYDVTDPRTGAPVAFGAYAQGFHDLITRPGGLVGDREGGYAFNNYDLVQAAALSRWLVQSVADWMSFRVAPKLVGGPVLTAVADRSGAKMIRPREITVRDFGRAADAVP
ncbi:MAG: hypothetical protein AB7J30_20700 [Hyphomicrobium sp.]|uniref:hypothetical protein n=1 Tax=Hyphomicrobium sp. TaxID=82 RepID=UPI003D0E60E4